MGKRVLGFILGSSFMDVHVSHLIASTKFDFSKWVTKVYFEVQICLEGYRPLKMHVFEKLHFLLTINNREEIVWLR